MPALPAVPKAVKFVLSGLINGTKPWVNAFHSGYSVGGALSAAEVLALAQVVNASWGANVAPLLTTITTLNSVVATALDSATAPVGVDGTVQTGGDADEPVAAGTAFVVQRKLSRRYRGGHSRVYIPGLPVHTLAAAADAILWDATFAALLLDAWADVEESAFTQLIADGRTDAHSTNISYFQGFTNFTFPSGRIRAISTPRVTPIVDPIVTWAFNPRPCSQRRRQQVV
jgi:hypothetical protein